MSGKDFDRAAPYASAFAIGIVLGMYIHAYQLAGVFLAVYGAFLALAMWCICPWRRQ